MCTLLHFFRVVRAFESKTSFRHDDKIASATKARSAAFLAFDKSPTSAREMYFGSLPFIRDAGALYSALMSAQRSNTNEAPEGTLKPDTKSQNAPLTTRSAGMYFRWKTTKSSTNPALTPPPKFRIIPISDEAYGAQGGFVRVTALRMSVQSMGEPF